MTRALHLVDSSADAQSETLAAQLAAEMGEGFEVQARHVHGWGSVAQSILGSRRSAGSFDLIHAFGAHSLATALSIGNRIIYSPSAFPRRRAIGWVRAAMAHRELHVVCPSDTMRRRFVENGTS